MRSASILISVLFVKLYNLTELLLTLTEILKGLMSIYRTSMVSWSDEKKWNLIKNLSFLYEQTNKQKQTNGTTILERGLPICGLRPNHVCEVSRRLLQLRI
jgi:hypothetical protein